VKPEPVDSVRVADMYSLFIALVGVLVVIWGVKQLLRLFTGDMEKD
jgi:flagellar biogenesis protein FliO